MRRWTPASRSSTPRTPIAGPMTIAATTSDSSAAPCVVAGRPLDPRRRHQGRRDASWRALGRGRPRQVPCRGGRGQLPGAGREAASLSTSFMRPTRGSRWPPASARLPTSSARVSSTGSASATSPSVRSNRRKRIVEIDSIQVEASLWHDLPFLGGVAGDRVTHRLRLLAYRPLGGVKSRSRIVKNPVLTAVAAQHPRDAVRRRAGVARGPLRGHRPSSWSDADRERAIDRATPSAASHR